MRIVDAPLPKGITWSWADSSRLDSGLRLDWKLEKPDLGRGSLLVYTTSAGASPFGLQSHYENLGQFISALPASPNFEWRELNQVEGTQAVLPFLEGMAHLQVLVYAKDEAGSYSNPAFASIAPTGLYLSHQSAGDSLISFTLYHRLGGSGAIGLLVYRDEELIEALPLDPGGLSAVRVVDRGLSYASTHAYRVALIDRANRVLEEKMLPTLKAEAGDHVGIWQPVFAPGAATPTDGAEAEAGPWLGGCAPLELPASGGALLVADPDPDRAFYIRNLPASLEFSLSGCLSLPAHEGVFGSTEIFEVDPADECFGDQRLSLSIHGDHLQAGESRIPLALGSKTLDFTLRVNQQDWRLWLNGKMYMVTPTSGPMGSCRLRWGARGEGMQVYWQNLQIAPRWADALAVPELRYLPPSVALPLPEFSLEPEAGAIRLDLSEVPPQARALRVKLGPLPEFSHDFFPDAPSGSLSIPTPYARPWDMEVAYIDARGLLHEAAFARCDSLPAVDETPIYSAFQALDYRALAAGQLPEPKADGVLF
ncbi:MAG: hypothetical protein HQL31_13800, partial [Planctomycetes bacterium]|nr:hypothetical protein [Planctomycetota bacterium]